MDAQDFDRTMAASGQKGMENLLSQLHHYQRQSEQLRRVNELYGRMAGILDLPTMIETYSIWLMQYVNHELIGYNNLSRERMHMFCSSHGPGRRHIIRIAEKLLHKPGSGSQPCRGDDELYSHKWSFESKDCCGVLVLLRRGNCITEEETDLINDSLPILAEPLKRALDYEEIFAQARRDTLTGLSNRLVFEERIPCLMEQARRHARPLTLAALDLDHFKEVNDSMGHLRGDEVLQMVAEVLQKQVRITDLLVRMGGDEFLVILPDMDLEAARYLSERLCRAVDSLNIKVESGKLGVSIGLAQWSEETSMKAWLEKADDILYQAKANGRARVAVN